MKGRPIDDTGFATLLETVPKVVGEDAADSWKYVLRGLWESALRIEELMNVSWDHPSRIRPIWADGQHPILEIPADMQKNGTHETIPILPGFEKILLETPETERKGWVFKPKSLQGRLGRKVRHQRPASDWVSRVISRIGAKAGIVVVEGDEANNKPTKYVSAHDLRRSCSKRLRYAGVPPLVISRILRHSILGDHSTALCCGRCPERWGHPAANSCSGRIARSPINETTPSVPGYARGGYLT